MRRLTLLTLALALLETLAGTSVAEAADPELVWKTFESDHFVIHYYQPHEDLARRVADVAERSHETLVPALGHAPTEKTLVVLTDQTDGANGFASVIPRNIIHLYASAPGSLSSLNDHDDWLYGLVLHEYAHILHLDTIGGIPWLYNQVFGKTWAPNQIQPRWFIEGLATYEESKRSSSGRLRSSLFDTYLRVAALERDELDLDQMTTGPLFWPHGNSAYIYGSHFLQYIAEKHGDEVIAAISREYGKQLVPFGLNRAVSRVVGEDYVTLYEQWRRDLRAWAKSQADAVLARGRIEGAQLTDTGQSNSIPRYTPDGSGLVWLQSDGRSRAGYKLMKRGGDTDSAKHIARIDGAGGFAFTPDGRSLVFERGYTYRTYYDWNDLFRVDLESGDITRLTYGARAAEVDVSPDGRWAAFIVNGGSKWRLARISLVPSPGEPPVPEILWEGPDRFDQTFSPHISSDGKRIVFTAWTKGGYHDLWLLDVESRKARRLTEDRAVDVEPRFIDGDRKVVFVSDRSGIYNLYALDLESGSLSQITNVLGGIIGFDVSPDEREVTYVGFDPDGFELFRMPFAPATWKPAEAVLADDRGPPTDVPRGWARVSAPRDYRALETLLPNNFALTTSVDAFGTAISLSFGGNDVAGHHAWSMAATYGLERGDVSWGVGYSYGRLWPQLRFGLGRGISRPGGLIVDTRNVAYEEESYGASASVSLPVLRRPNLNSDISVSYDIDWLRNVNELPDPDPNTAVMQPPETGWIGSLGFRWSMSNVRRYVFSLGPAEGRSLTLGLRLEHPNLGSDKPATEFTWRWTEGWQMPWSPEHLLSLRYSGGIEESQRRRDGAYSLGGVPTQDIVSAIVDQTRVSLTNLRGYPGGSFRGRQFHLATLEYRFPLFTIEKGFATLPLYFRRVHIAGFSDTGNAFDGPFDPGDLKVSLGGALRLDTVFGYYASGTLELGVARGLMDEGVTQWWFLLTQTL